MENQNNEQLSFEKVWLMFQETDRKFQETQEEIKKTNEETKKEIKRLADLFTTQWGKLVEALLGPSCLKMFKKIGIRINESQSRVEAFKGGEKMEIDVLLVNGNEIVAIEIKTKAKIDYVENHLEKLKRFKYFFPRYKLCKVYGAIAALRFEEGSDIYSEKRGLYVIKSTADGLMSITNKKRFLPCTF